MARIVNVHEAKTHFSKLIDDVFAGEEVIVAKAGKPYVKVVPLEYKKAPRRLGLHRGPMSLEAIAESLRPLSEEELAEWYK